MEKKHVISEMERMKSLFGYKRGVVISEQIPRPNNRAAIDNTYVRPPIVPPTNPQQLGNQPVTANATTNNSEYFTNPDGSIQVKELPGVTVTASRKAKPQAAKQPQFVAEKFPLKYMMQGDNVKKLQQALGVVNSQGQPNISGKFYNATQTALDAKAKELGIAYDRNVGLDQEAFNQIVQGEQPQKQLAKPEPIATTKTAADINKAPAVPANLTAKAPQIQAPKVELNLDQQFQMAKANLDKAKAELDAAQKTNDRAQIGAARGKQQAARQEVQRLRNELANQGQQQ